MDDILDGLIFGPVTNNWVANHKFTVFVNSFKKYFSNMWMWVDEDTGEAPEWFDRDIQKLFLNTFFRYGSCGIYDNKGNAVPVAVWPTEIDHKGMTTKGTARLASMIRTIKTRGEAKDLAVVYQADMKNTAFAQWDFFYNSGEKELYSSAVMYAETWAIIRSNSKLSMDMFEVKNAGEEEMVRIKADILDIDKVFIDKTKSKTDYKTKQAITPEDLFNEEMKKFGNNDNGKMAESIPLLIQSLDKIVKDAQDIIGRRQNVHKGAARSITADFEQDEIGFELFENDYQTHLENFTKQLNVLFSKEKPVVLVSRIELIREQEHLRALEVQEAAARVQTESAERIASMNTENNNPQGDE